MTNLFKLFAFVALIGIVIFPTVAFASSNSGMHTSGEGVGAISGWAISNLKYQSSADPSMVSGVNFDLDGAANRVSVKLTSSDVQYTNCTNINDYHWQCDFPAGARISGLDEFHVIAIGN